jgi:hypothetical protein
VVDSGRARGRSAPALVAGLDARAPYFSRLSARSALYTELRLLLDGRPMALAVEAYRSLVVEENCLARPSYWSRRKLWQELHSPISTRRERPTVRCILGGVAAVLVRS